jgi:thiaminase
MLHVLEIENKINSMKTLFVLVDKTLKLYKNNLTKLHQSKDMISNFSKSLKNKSYVEYIMSNNYLMDRKDSILDTFKVILDYFLQNGK